MKSQTIGMYVFVGMCRLCVCGLCDNHDQQLEVLNNVSGALIVILMHSLLIFLSIKDFSNPFESVFSNYIRNVWFVFLSLLLHFLDFFCRFPLVMVVGYGNMVTHTWPRLYIDMSVLQFTSITVFYVVTIIYTVLNKPNYYFF